MLGSVLELDTYAGAGCPETGPGDGVTQGVVPAAPPALLALVRSAGLLVLSVTRPVRLGEAPAPGPGSSDTGPVAPAGGGGAGALLDLQGQS